jgi:ribosomal protein S7
MVKKSRIILNTNKKNYLKKKIVKHKNIIENKKKKFSIDIPPRKLKFLALYTGMLITKGYKGKIEQGFFTILRNLKKTKKKYLITNYLYRAMNQARPFLTLIAIKKGSMTYQVPAYISIKREIFQGIYWLIKETCGLKKRNYQQELLKEFINISFRRGNAVKAKEKLHQASIQNRVYIRFLSRK